MRSQRRSRSIAYQRPMTEPTRTAASARGPGSSTSAQSSRRARPAIRGSVSRPSVKQWITRSRTESRAGELEQGLRGARGSECTPPSETSPIRWTRSEQVRASHDRGILAQRHRRRSPSSMRVRSWRDDGAGAEVEVADLGVAHLPLGQPHRAPGSRERRVGVGGPQLVEDRGARRARRRCRGRARRGPSRRARPGRRRPQGSDRRPRRPNRWWAAPARSWLDGGRDLDVVFIAGRATFCQACSWRRPPRSRRTTPPAARRRRRAPRRRRAARAVGRRSRG